MYAWMICALAAPRPYTAQSEWSQSLGILSEKWCALLTSFPCISLAHLVIESFHSIPLHRIAYLNSPSTHASKRESDEWVMCWKLCAFVHTSMRPLCEFNYLMLLLLLLCIVSQWIRWHFFFDVYVINEILAVDEIRCSSRTLYAIGHVLRLDLFTTFSPPLPALDSAVRCVRVCQCCVVIK